MHALFAVVGLALSAVVTGACGGTTSEVPVKGNDSQLVGIAGEWVGEYKGTESGRTGPVSFSLGVGRHTAEGTVRMGGQTPLKIQFVSVESGDIHGTMEPYTDPACDCQVETTFVGTQNGNRIDGTFTAKMVASGTEQHGTWGVTRIKE
jgi:hypothetical protein